jgi:2-oxoisovalerate dehydrogenase E1 component alpha subunit
MAMSDSSSFNAPPAPARPGQESNFGYLHIDPAGASRRPSADVKSEATADLARGLVRVLDHDGHAVGEWDPHLASEKLLTGLRMMVLTRCFDDRMQLMQRQGKLTFYMKSTGEEGVTVAQTMALRRDDMIFPSYRNQASHFVRGRRPIDLMCMCLSNTRDMCKGRQMPVFYHWAEGSIFSISGNLGTQFPIGVGWAMAETMKGRSRIAHAWIGEGASAEADFHHALVFAGVYQAPIILNVVNNQWAISTFQSVAGGNLAPFAARGLPYGIAGIRVDGNDFLATYSATEWAAKRARAKKGPTLIELVTYRAGAHSTSDDPSKYRPKDDAAAWPLGDPIARLKQHLIATGVWSEAQHAALIKNQDELVLREWSEAISYGTLAGHPRLDPRTMFEDVFKDVPLNLKRQREQLDIILREQEATNLPRAPSE